MTTPTVELGPSPLPAHRFRGVRLALAAVALAAAAVGCGASGGSSSLGSMTPVARVGDLEIINPFLPKPASPSVASVYLTVRNTGTRDDELVSATTPLTNQASLMSETGDTMSALRELPIPAHGLASLSPGKDHLMLTDVTSALKVDDHVEVTLRFAHAGTVTVRVPVVPLSAIVNDGGMANMPGM